LLEKEKPRRMSDKNFNEHTLCVHGGAYKLDETGAISTPIYQSATFVHEGVGKDGFVYTRQENPTRNAVEARLASLENAACALAFSSGMAAVVAIFEMFNTGDEIVACDDLYGGTHRFFSHIRESKKVQFSFGSDTDGIISKITKNTKAVYIETPTNPMMRVFDIAKIAKVAKANDALLIADNTFLTPIFQKPLELGADIVIHSGSKYLGGHNDTISGFLAVNTRDLFERLRFISTTIGSALSPFDSFLINRGMKTLALRVRRQEENAKKIVEFLGKQDCIEEVYYPGLSTHKDFDISKKQANGFGAMVSFRIKKASDAPKILEGVKLISYAESLGGVESLLTYPLLQTHADVPEAERLRLGIDDRLLRLSVGIEDCEDLISDLVQAFRR
jgi:cystathionine gamma-synthase